MATTTNYSWSTPDDTSLVKDGAAAIRTLGSSIDTTTKALNPSTTLGDIEYRSSTANTNTRLAIGTTGQVLTVSGGVPAWATASAPTNPAFRAFRNTSQQSFSQNTWTKVQFNAETFDTASCFDSTTNYRFTPNVAGYYQFNCLLYVSKTGQSLTAAQFYKNGSAVSKVYEWTNTSTYSQMNGSDIIYLNGSTDYVEVYVYDGDPSARNVDQTSGTTSYLSGVWIRG